MTTKKTAQGKGPITILKSALYILLTHRVVMLPLFLLAFLQVWLIEILFFAPRYPLNIFFGPIIRRLWSETFLHYPFNFIVLQKMFYFVQTPIYIFLGSFAIAMMISLLKSINDGHAPRLKPAIQETLSRYIHVALAALLAFGLMKGLFKCYDLIYNRALLIKSTSGKFFFLKQLVLEGSPYFKLLISVLVTILTAYLFPVIMVDKKKIFSALILNFKTLFATFWSTAMVVFIPSVLFVPLLVLRVSLVKGDYMLDTMLIILVVSVLLSFIVDALIYTGVTTVYLLRKEQE